VTSACSFVCADVRRGHTLIDAAGLQEDDILQSLHARSPATARDKSIIVFDLAPDALSYVAWKPCLDGTGKLPRGSLAPGAAAVSCGHVVLLFLSTPSGGWRDYNPLGSVPIVLPTPSYNKEAFARAALLSALQHLLEHVPYAPAMYRPHEQDLLQRWTALALRRLPDLSCRVDVQPVNQEMTAVCSRVPRQYPHHPPRLSLSCMPSSRLQHIPAQMHGVLSRCLRQL
jgi:hypothetical protein